MSIIKPADALLMALGMAAGAGFIAGKLDIDERIRESIERSHIRMARLTAASMADELESRKLAIPVKAADANS